MAYLYLSFLDVISLLVVIFSGEILNFVIWITKNDSFDCEKMFCYWMPWCSIRGHRSPR